MNIFSVVSATFDSESLEWLPPQCELQNFVKHLCGVEIKVSEEDGNILAWGNLEDIVNIKVQDAMVKFITDRKVPEQTANTENVVRGTNDHHKGSLGKSTNSSSTENDGSSIKAGDCENEDCLNIEVLDRGPIENEGSISYKFCCQICSFKSHRESHFQRHLDLHKARSTIYSCDECDFRTLKLTHLRRHQTIHTNRRIDCSSCSYSTDDPKLLDRHERKKHRPSHLSASDQQEIKFCQICPYQTGSIYLFERHMKVHSAEEKPAGPDIFTCSQCDYRTTRKMHYVRHVRDVHSQLRPYLCDLCGKAFKRSDALKQHSFLHVPLETTVTSFHFQCNICHKVCHSKAHLKEHAAVHSSVRSYLCEICGASFKTRSVQRKHIINVHQNPRSFTCQVCHKRLSSSYALVRHMKQHPLIPVVTDSSKID